MQNEMGDGVVEAEGLAEVGVENTAPVVGVLLAERSVEAVGVAGGGDVGERGRRHGLRCRARERR